MTKYTERPSWFYKPIHIENLEEIQKELKIILYKNFPNLRDAPPQFIYSGREKIEPFAPLLTEYVKSIGLLDEWYAAHIITTNYHYKFPIHIDDPNWYRNCYGLNIPIMNCEDTYTVWYDTEIGDDSCFDTSNPLNVAKLIKSSEPPAHDLSNWKDNIANWKGVPSTEIARYHMKGPAWINVSIPHAPVSNHKKFRAVISLRFDQTNLHDMLYNP
jgi:hypothetical protein